MEAISYLPNALRHPDQTPIEEIPQTLDSVTNVITATRLTLQLDMIHATRALQQLERVQTILKQRLLDYVQDLQGLPRIDVAQYEAENGVINHHALYAAADHQRDDQQNAAFSVKGAIDRTGKYIKMLGEVYQHVQKIVNIVSPVTGVKPVSAQSNSAFERDIAITWKAQKKPDLLYLSLFTPEALALLLRETRKAEQAVALVEPDLIFDVPLEKYLEDKEDQNAANYLLERGGYYYCRTQTQENLASLVVGGTNKGEITLWQNGSILKWRLIDETFQTQQQFTYAEIGMQTSTSAWNRISPGGVTFERAESAAEATFKVVFTKKQEGKIAADAFFPANYVKNVSTITIYPIAFDDRYVMEFSKILAHELGHVLGFRHEFALETERKKLGGRFGTKDPLSVMTYQYPPLFSFRDVTTSRSAYQHFQGDGEFRLPDGKGRNNAFTVTRKDPTQ